jgi:hypothetical protein
MFGLKKKGPTQPFQHAEDCRIWKTDPGVQIPWSEIRRGVWEGSVLRRERQVTRRRRQSTWEGVWITNVGGGTRSRGDRSTPTT